MRVKRSSSLLPEIHRERQVKIQVDGKHLDAFEGESVAAALIAAGIHKFRMSQKNNEPRSVYCGMGTCCECMVTVNGVHSIRACMTQVTDGMQIETCTTASPDPKERQQ